MNEWIELLTVTRTLTTGHYTETVTVNGVWAEERSVTRSEFYQAYAAGLKAEKAFKVNTDELGAASYVRHNGVKYKILRTYRLDAQYTEITVGEQVGAPAAAPTNGGADDGETAD